MSIQRRLGRDVAVGDMLMFLGHPHLIDRIDPYGPTNIPEIITPDTRIARNGRDWGITLFADQDYEVHVVEPASIEAGA